MKRSTLTPLIGLLLGTLACLSVAAAAELKSRVPPLDAEGRFWLYTNMASAGPLPFVPYGWMPKEASNLMTVDLGDTDLPHTDGRPGRGDTCISVTIQWAAPYWCGVAFISGPEGWWGDDNQGWHYELSGLKKRKLVFWARGQTGQESIQVKFGTLGHKKFGDSLPFPQATAWLKLTPQWTRYELDLSACKPEHLQRICNGFTFVTNQDSQRGQARQTTKFYLDDLYLE